MRISHFARRRRVRGLTVRKHLREAHHRYPLSFERGRVNSCDEVRREWLGADTGQMVETRIEDLAIPRRSRNAMQMTNRAGDQARQVVVPVERRIADGDMVIATGGLSGQS